MSLAVEKDEKQETKWQSGWFINQMSLQSVLLSIIKYTKICKSTNHCFDIWRNYSDNTMWHYIWHDFCAVIWTRLNSKLETNKWFIKNGYDCYLIQWTNWESFSLYSRPNLMFENWGLTATMSTKCNAAHLNKYTCIFANRIQYGKQMHRKKETGGGGHGEENFCFAEHWATGDYAVTST